MQRDTVERMEVLGFDHIVISCRSVNDMVAFYRDVLGFRVGEERPGKWAVWLGEHKISLQDDADKPPIAAGTVPGSGNYCVLAVADIGEIRRHLVASGVDIVDEGRRIGARGPIESIYIHDPEGNLVEIANYLE